MTACKWPQVRNHATGRCKKPCGKHQGISPNTGKCVTKTYLQAKRIKGDFTKAEYRKAIRDDGITRRDGRSRRSGARTTSSLGDYGDFNFTEYDYKEPRNRYSYSSKYRDNIRDGLVRDKSCPQGWRNRLTWRCKTPCEPGKVINPLTMGCVTKGYAKLISPMDFDDYDTDEDDPDAANLKWTPTTHQTASVPHTDDDMKKFINDSQLGVADIRTLRGLQEGIEPKGSTIYGIYSPSQRQGCDRNTLLGLFSTPQTKCGFKNLTKDATQVWELVKYGGNDHVVFAESGGCSDFLNANTINGLLGGYQTMPKGEYRLVNACNEGLWKLLVRVNGKPFVKIDQDHIDSFKDNAGNFDFDAVSNALNHINVNRISIAYHKFDEQTKV